MENFFKNYIFIELIFFKFDSSRVDSSQIQFFIDSSQNTTLKDRLLLEYLTSQFINDVYM